MRAGAGSARDTLSVLDQLLGGAGPEGVTYDLASGLLGYTPDTLLDEVVDAFAAGDGASVFGVVDKVIETGQDPRRFTEDLLRRLRDLVIVAAVPDAPATGLIDVSDDQGERLVAQASRFGRADLSRAADLVAVGLTEMRGATAPRLLLELICARVLLPGADHTTHGVQARLDRLERRAVDHAARRPAVPVRGAAPRPGVARRGAPAPPPVPGPGRAAGRPLRPSRSRAGARARAAATPRRPSPCPAARAGPGARARPLPSASARPRRRRRRPPRSRARAGRRTRRGRRGGGRPGRRGARRLVDVRRLWPDIVEATKQRRRMTWIHLTQNAQVVAVDAKTLTLGFANAGARDSFDAGGSAEIVRQAAIDVDRLRLARSRRSSTRAPTPGAAPPPAAEARRCAASPTPGAVAEAGARPRRAAGPPPPDEPPPWADRRARARARPQPRDPQAAGAARRSGRPGRPARPVDAARRPRWPRPTPTPAPTTSTPTPSMLGTDDLLARELGAQVIEEIPHQ